MSKSERVTSTNRSVQYGVMDGEIAVFIPLTRGKVAVIDAESWAEIEPEHGSRWDTQADGKGNFYARGAKHTGAGGNDDRPVLHRAAVGAKPGQRVTFINGDSLDCRRCNLRFETKAETAERTERARQRAAEGRPNV